jgi:tRNA-binding protein
MKKEISWPDFEKIDIKTGTIIRAETFPEAHKKSYKLQIDFGQFGILWSSAQITELYTPELLIGKSIVAIINFPRKQIANFFSECLVLGIYNLDGAVVLLTPDKDVENGLKIG